MSNNNRTANTLAFLLGAAVGGGIAMFLNSRQGKEKVTRLKEYLEQSGERVQEFGQKIQENLSEVAASVTETKDNPES